MKSLFERINALLESKSICGDKEYLENTEALLKEISLISEGHKTDNAICNSGNITKDIFNSANFGMAIVSKDSKILMLNKAFADLFKYSISELTGSELYKLFYNSVNISDCPACVSIREYTKAKVEFWDNNIHEFLEVSVDPVSGSETFEECSLVSVRNISERKLIEQELSLSEKRYKALFENRHTVMLLINPVNGEIVNANPAAEKFYGYPVNLLESMNISDLNILTTEEILAEMNRSRKKEKNRFIFRHKLSNGDIRMVEVFSGPVLHDGKELMFSIIHDITEKQKLYQELEDTNSELIKAKHIAERSNQLKSAFLANMSHEIRTPLNGILGFAELLSLENIDDLQRKKYAGIITESGKKLLDIINDILDLSKIEAGEINLNFEEFDVVQLFNDIYLFHLERQIPGLRFDFIKPSAERILIVSDKTRLFQIVNNLLSNAFKFTKKGLISLGYRLSGSELIVDVKDTGIGISNEFQSAVFDRFVQLENSDLGVKGTGLGLSIVKSLCKLLGGDIELYSETGKGSHFKVTIPVNNTLGNQEPSNSNSKPEKLKMGELKTLIGTVIIAEDEEINREFFYNALNKSDIRIFFAKNGVEVVELAHKYPDADLILMDIKMPILNGLEASKRILKDFPDMKIVAHSAYAREEDLARNIEAGCIDYMSKPFKVNVLIEMLGKYLKRKE